jgi:hypothetical protein
MAISTSSIMAITLMPVSEKFVCTNYMVWKAQVLAVLRGAQLAEFLDGTTAAPGGEDQVEEYKSGRRR